MTNANDHSQLELWAGMECTVNRVGDRYFDQCEKNGHSLRPDDYQRFAEIGVKTIRFPALWEKTAPHDLQAPDWSEIDTSLERMQTLHLTPIIGLLHHGSGPHYTSLIDPDFAAKFTDYAVQFASRYPWAKLYTPINEPLTTARFSGLYGFWYPHARDDKTFLRILLNELRATVLAMKAIRQIQPQAQLIQTEDLGRVTSTPKLAYQAEFENHRRWLTFDFLCGRVTEKHPLWSYFINHNLLEKELIWFLENPCPPDIIGINHYLLSNRFLDDRMDLYPSRLHGGNAYHRYADVGAVDTAAAISASPYEILKEVWQRYESPFAVTEVHVNGHRESQMRWLYEIWKTATTLKSEGCDIRAVTAWSLLGSFDWNSLCTTCDNYYEPGVFDVRAPHPRGTGLARMVSAFCRGKECDHPVLDQMGWWHDSQRRLYAHKAAHGVERNLRVPLDKASPRPLLITGATGTLGRAFAQICEHRGLAYHLIGRDQMDIAHIDSVRSILKQIQPWAVINTAGYVKVDQAELEQEQCFRENVVGAETLAIASADAKIPIITFSSDLVFDGTLNSPYLESHNVSPLNVYGRSKAEAEKRVMQTHDKALIIRTSAFFSPWDEYNFIILTLRQLAQGHDVTVIDNMTISPTYVPDLVHACLDLLIDGERGIWHLTNQGQVTWVNLAKMAADRAQIKEGRIVTRQIQECDIVAPRPAYSALSSERAHLLPTLEHALNRYFSELAVPFLHPV